MEEKKELKIIDVIDIAKELWPGRYSMPGRCPSPLSYHTYLYIGFSRYYGTDIKLAPELGESSLFLRIRGERLWKRTTK
jgi:hypothetical protein